MTWKVYETNPNGFRYANIANGDGKLIFQSVHTQTNDAEVAKALSDARLAAAAPAMLAAINNATFALNSIIMLSTELNRQAKASLAPYITQLEAAFALATKGDN